MKITTVKNYYFVGLLPIYFFIIIISSFFSHGFGSIHPEICPQHPPISLLANVNEIINCYGGMDVASYIRGAFGLEKNGLKLFGSLGFATWPPGFSFLELGLIRLDLYPLGLSLLIITYCLWSILLLMVFKLLRVSTNLSFLISAFIPTLLLLTPFISNFYLWQGLLMSEPISTAIFFIALIGFWELALSSQIVGKGRAIFFGVLIAVSIYLRAQFDIIFSTLSIIIFIFFLATFTLKKFLKVSESFWIKLKHLTKLFLVIFITAQILILPYKIYMFKNGHGPVMANVFYMFNMVWQNTTDLNRAGAMHFVDGGGNSICQLAPEKCNEFIARKYSGQNIPVREYQNSALLAVISQPIKFMEIKYPFFHKAWSIDNLENAESNRRIVIFNTIILLSFLVVAILFISRNKKRALLELLVIFSFFIGATGFSWITHFEARYLLPVKLLILIWIFISIASLLSPKRGSLLK